MRTRKGSLLKSCYRKGVSHHQATSVLAEAQRWTDGERGLLRDKEKVPGMSWLAGGKWSSWGSWRWNNKKQDHSWAWWCHFCCLITESHPTLLTPWITARQAPLSMEFSRQEYWSGLPFPSLLCLVKGAYFTFSCCPEVDNGDKY